MNRQQIVESLRQQGFSAKTLMNFTDKQLSLLSNKILGEQVTPIPPKQPALKIGPKGGELPPSPKGYTVSQNPTDKTIVAVAKESEMKEGKLSKKQSNKMDTDKDGDIDKKDLENLRIGKKKKGKVGENLEITEWVDKLVKKQYHPMVTKNELMETLTKKLNEKATVIPMPAKARKGHNGVPEFMTYDSIANAGEPQTKPAPKTDPTPVKDPGEKQPPRVDPRKTPFRNPGKDPKPNPNPKATKKNYKLAA